MSGATQPRGAQGYASPYVAGAGLGVVLLASYILAGRGIGATGAFAVVAANTLSAATPAVVRSNAWLAERATGSILRDWLVVEIIGVVIGGFISAALGGRLQLGVDRGPRLGIAPRLAIAALGGATMGFGAVFARGCTSGQALTGGALLSAGSWLFVLGAFGAGYLTMFFARRAWT